MLVVITKKKFIDIVSAICFTKTIIALTLAFTDYMVLCVPILTCSFIILLLGITIEDNDRIFEKETILPRYQKKIPLYPKVKTP
jgi:hypothetical protein